MVRRQDSKSSYRLFIPIPTIIRLFIWQISRRQSAAPQWIHELISTRMAYLRSHRLHGN